MAKKPPTFKDNSYIKNRVDALAYEDAERNYPVADTLGTGNAAPAGAPWSVGSLQRAASRVERVKNTGTGGIKSTRPGADTSKNQRPDPRL